MIILLRQTHCFKNPIEIVTVTEKVKFNDCGIMIVNLRIKFARPKQLEVCKHAKGDAPLPVIKSACLETSFGTIVTQHVVSGGSYSTAELYVLM
jgi:hypothetical protein